MRLAKITYHIGFKNGAHKFEQQQQIENTAKIQGTTGGKRFSASHSIYSNSNCGSARGSGSGSGSGSGGSGGVAATNNRSSIGNGSCVSSSTTSDSAAGSAKRRKSKSKKCFSSTVFRCCIPCRGGGSAAPATSPPLSPVSPADDVNNGTTAIATQKKYAKVAHDKKRDTGAIGAPYAEIDADIDIDVDADAEAAAVAANGKKHSLADTIATSATTPISLKTLINYSEEELEPPPFSVADIAAATLATGIVARKAEPETLSDASVSPTAAIQQLPFGGAHFTAVRHSALASASALSVNVTSAQHISPIKSTSTLPAVTSFATAIGHSNVAATLTQQQQVPPPPPPAGQSAQRVSQSQTSPLPHIEEEEESEHIGNRQQYSPPADLEQGFVGVLSAVSDSSESTNAPQSTNTSISAPTGGSSACHCHQELVTQSASTPSPRIKLKFRKQHKSGWCRSALAPSSAAGGGTGGGAGSSGVGGGGSGSAGATSNETLASNGSNTNTATSASSSGLHRISLSSVPHVSSSQLLPALKMQAEQGSIGDLQKYHSRYLKNRRHTLANVR